MKYAATVIGLFVAGGLISCIADVFKNNNGSSTAAASDSLATDTTSVALKDSMQQVTRVDGVEGRTEVPVVEAEQAKDSMQQVTPADGSEAVDASTELPDVEAEQAKDKEELTYTVKQGDNLWNIVKNKLKTEKGIEKPTNKQIAEGVGKLMEENGLHYETDGYVVIIHPFDKITYKTL